MTEHEENTRPEPPPSSWGPIIAGVLLLLFGSVFAWRTLLTSGGEGAGAGPRGPKKVDEAAAVEVATVRTGRLHNARRLPGEILAPRAVDLAAASAGEVEAVLVELGDRVKAGQVLLRLERTTPWLETKRAEAVLKGEQARQARAKLEVERAQQDLLRYRKLQQEGAISGRELRDKETETKLLEADLSLRVAEVERVQADLELKRADLSRTVVRAPFAGTIQERLTELGARVAVGTPVFKLLEEGQNRVRFSVPPTLSTPPHPGDKILVKSHRGPASAVVTKIAQGLSEGSRGRTVEAALQDGAGLLPGAFVEVELSTGAFGEHPLVPVVALLGRGKERKVFLSDTGKVQKRNVTVLAEDDVNAAVDGLQDGDQVVVRGQNGLKDGDAVDARAISDSGDG